MMRVVEKKQIIFFFKYKNIGQHYGDRATTMAEIMDGSNTKPLFIFLLIKIFVFKIKQLISWHKVWRLYLL